MMILERILDRVLVPESPEQADSRSTMRGFFRAEEAGLLLDFAIRGQKMIHSIIDLLLILLWMIMMFFPSYMETIPFKIFFSVSVICAMIYSFCRKKYFSLQPYRKAEKYVFALLILSLLVRLLVV
ncbi:hypothetical protein MR478_05010 [bacterium]|nr:hypothetical protein [bacterium]